MGGGSARGVGEWDGGGGRWGVGGLRLVFWRLGAPRMYARARNRRAASGKRKREREPGNEVNEWDKTSSAR